MFFLSSAELCHHLTPLYLDIHTEKILLGTKTFSLGTAGTEHVHIPLVR